MGTASPARRAALAALTAVADGQRATAALHASFAQNPLPARDRALATELVYGVLRWQGQLDWLIDRAAEGGRHRPSGPVRHVLRLAAYELLHLQSVPARATCHQAVELVREYRPQAAGFVNALCRRMQRLTAGGTEHLWPDADEDPVAHLAVRYSHPHWMVARWLQRWGWEETEALLAANNVPPPLTVRVNRLRTDRETVLARWRAAGLDADVTELSPDGLRLHGTEGGVPSLPGFAEGWFVVQDESSQLVGWAVAPRPGERVLDMCSAPGGKTTHLAELMEDRGTIVALDVEPSRLRLLEDNVRRLGLRSIVPRALDAAAVAGAGLEPFDRVLLDAPCTGLGVLRRRAEARWQKKPDDVQALAELQRRLLDQAATQVRPGGVLVYTVCTTEPEETVNQIDGFLARWPQFRPDPLAPVLPPSAARLVADGAATLTLLPHRHGVDGFFIARLVHRL